MRRGCWRAQAAPSAVGVPGTVTRLTGGAGIRGTVARTMYDYYQVRDGRAH